MEAGAHHDIASLLAITWLRAHRHHRHIIVSRAKPVTLPREERATSHGTRSHERLPTFSDSRASTFPSGWFFCLQFFSPSERKDKPARRANESRASRDGDAGWKLSPRLITYGSHSFVNFQAPTHRPDD